ncbi:glycosyltransferase family 2 protein [Cohnella thailandensis]|uniref:Glycosyltransferase family 2 protein n=1 Tax=Cohnella thailandensis TaxID=557557 RepID=A0A841SXF6_9BACL|nr:glycosyltransferase family 2 protein [Cohnella thailandensis]MBB6634855.1 glycosyltransferase family 2 protein [Cohnella thailandensis]MBP1975923.1 cellulose synthase/poly-beta-1,6-N-acetylglucosamine synthase-like glycosyltransferase [Cohnella thailandensis]
MREILLGYGSAITYYVVAVTLIYFVILFLSYRGVYAMRKGAAYSKFQSLAGSESAPPVSLLVPAYNEELTIIDNVKNLLTLHYHTYEVIVVNDGSNDNTLKVLIQAFGLVPKEDETIRYSIDCTQVRTVYHNPEYPNLFVVDKPNGGKADSLNAGINLSHYPLICSIDADSLLEKDALIRMARVYMENPAETVAIGGNVRIANGCTIRDGVVEDVRLPRKMWPMFQTLEYMKAFLGGRIGWSHINGLIIVSGAFGMFRKDKVVEVGGYRDGYPGEDMNIIIKLHRHMLDQKLPYRVAYCPDAVCWTQAPDTYRILSSQRKRWGRGNLKNMIENRDMFFRPKYKVFGMLTVPYNVLFETLNPYFKLTGLLALIGYVAMDMTKWPVLLVFAAINFLSGYLLAVGSLVLEQLAFQRYPRMKDMAKMIGFSALMFLGYYQLGVLWRFQGHIEYLRKNNTWGVMTRQSWNQDATTTTSP